MWPRVIPIPLPVSNVARDNVRSWETTSRDKHHEHIINEALKCKTLGAIYDRSSDVAVMFSASVYTIVHQLPYAYCMLAYEHIQQQHLYKLFHIAYQYIANTKIFTTTSAP